MPTKIAEKLHKIISKVCPIVGVSIGDEEDKQTWTITYATGSTSAQQTAAQAALTAFSSGDEPKSVDTLEAKEHFRPLDILFYNGYPSDFNSSANSEENEKVAQDMARYELVVLGEGLQDSGHADYSNTQAIITRIKAINPWTKVLGAVSGNQTQNNFESKADDWNDLDADGIFIDDMGYEKGLTRSNQNELIDYVHGLDAAMICMVSATTLIHVLGTEDDPSYPNSTYNSSEDESRLDEDDWVLVKSFAVDTTAHSGNNGYQSKSDWFSLGQKIASLRQTYNVKFCGVSVINDDNSNGEDLFDFAYVSTLMWSLDAFGSSNTSFGSSDNNVKWWDRVDTKGMIDVYNTNPPVIQDAQDSDVYFRYLRKGKLSLDFSSGAQTYSIQIR